MEKISKILGHNIFSPGKKIGKNRHIHALFLTFKESKFIIDRDTQISIHLTQSMMLFLGFYSEETTRDVVKCLLPYC